VTLNDLAGRLTCTVPEAGQLLGISRSAAFRAAERGEIPTLRLGRRLVVPVPKLLELVGASPNNSDGPDATSEPIATTVEAEKEPRNANGTPSLPRSA
jgi:hypothetical protein